MNQRTELGRIVRLQIQTSNLKAGPPRGKYYDPQPLREVAWLEVNLDGAIADVDGQPTIDVHNVTHPESKNRSGINPLSFGFTSHYDQMRHTLDNELADGIAGENILIDTDRLVTLADVADGIEIKGDDGRIIALTTVSVAHPCVEFSRFAMGDSNAPAAAVSETLRFLDNGLRDFYAAAESSQAQRIQPGDRVFAILR